MSSPKHSGRKQMPRKKPKSAPIMGTRWSAKTCALRGEMFNELAQQHSQHVQQFGALVQAFTSQAQEVRAVVEGSRKTQEAIEGRLSGIESSVGELVNVRANGTVGFQAVMHEILEATKAQRARRKMIDRFFEWLNAHATLAKILKWGIPRLVLLFLGLLVLSFLRDRGIDLDLWGLLRHFTIP